MIVYRCRSCGFILEIVDNDRTLDDSISAAAVVAGYRRCPRCGARLERPSLSNITIRNGEHAERLADEARRQILDAIALAVRKGR